MSNIFQRVSVREYRDAQVEDDKIEHLLKAAMAAPSAANQQPWEFYVVKNQAVKKQLAAVSPYAGCAEKAPVVLVPCFRTEGLIFPAGAQIDLSACCENILLDAVDQGLGAVWLGIAPFQERMDNVAKILGLPHNLSAFALIACGYPKRNAEQKNRYDATRVHFVE